MIAIIMFILVICVLGSISENENQTNYNSNTYTKSSRPSKKEIKAMKKARDRAEMEAFEDAYMFYEAFMDD